MEIMMREAIIADQAHEIATIMQENGARSILCISLYEGFFLNSLGESRH